MARSLPRHRGDCDRGGRGGVTSGIDFVLYLDKYQIMELEHAVTALAALAHATRLEVFRRLVVAGPKGLAAGAVAEELAVAPATLSFHLKELSRAGLVRSRRQGRQIFYAVDFAGARGLFDYLMQDCCQGRIELCGPFHAPGEACVVNTGETR